MDGNDFPKLGIKTQELVDRVELALLLARKCKEDFGAVNWGDLGVADVEYRLSMLRPGDGPTCVVIIEEASPDCKLPQWIAKQIEDIPNVFIECEW